MLGAVTAMYRPVGSCVNFNDPSCTSMYPQNCAKWMLKIVKGKWLILYLLIEINTSKLCQQHKIVTRTMHFEIVNVASSIELTEDFNCMMLLRMVN